MNPRFPEHISNEELQELPSGAFEGEIEVIDNEDSALKACEVLRAAGAIGFDTETRPSFRKGVTNTVALLQLSTSTRAFLFRICDMPLPQCVAELFEDTSVLKIGAAIRDDIRTLQHSRKFTSGGFIDLQHIVNEYGIAELSVRKFGGIVLGIRISKAQRLSNWEAKTLTPAQQSYAATDAWVCLEVYKILMDSPKNPLPKPAPKEKPEGESKKEVMDNPAPKEKKKPFHRRRRRRHGDHGKDKGIPTE